MENAENLQSSRTWPDRGPCQISGQTKNGGSAQVHLAVVPPGWYSKNNQRKHPPCRETSAICDQTAMEYAGNLQHSRTWADGGACQFSGQTKNGGSAQVHFAVVPPGWYLKKNQRKHSRCRETSAICDHTAMEYAGNLQHSRRWADGGACQF